MKILSQRLILALFATLCALCLCACSSSSSSSASSHYSPSASASYAPKPPKISIEKSKDPLFGTSLWFGRFVKITSTDRATELLGMRVNEGNCAFLLYKLDEKRLEAYEKRYFHLKEGFVYDRNGYAVVVKKSVFSSDRAYYDALSADAQALYTATFPIKLPYGAKARLDGGAFGCDLKEDIIKIELALKDHGDYTRAWIYTYEFDGGGKGELLVNKVDKEDGSVIESVGNLLKFYVSPIASLLDVFF